MNLEQPYTLYKSNLILLNQQQALRIKLTSIYKYYNLKEFRMEQTIELSKKQKLKKFNQKLDLMMKAKIKAKDKPIQNTQQIKTQVNGQIKTQVNGQNVQQKPAQCIEKSNGSQLEKNNQDRSKLQQVNQNQNQKDEWKTKKIKKQEKDKKYSKNEKPLVSLRKAAGQVWEDKSMLDWPQNGYRIFCGNLGNQVSDQILSNVFRNRYSSFQMGRVVRDKRTGKSRGYGFISFAQPKDFLNALKQMDGKHVGNRPVKLSKSNWKDRQLNSEQNKILPSDFKINSGKQTNKICVNYKYTSSF